MADFNQNNFGSGVANGSQNQRFRTTGTTSDSEGGSSSRTFKALGPNANTRFTTAGKKSGFKSGFFKTPTRGKNAFGFLNKQGRFQAITDKNKLKQLRAGKFGLIDNPFRNNLLRLAEQHKEREKFQADVPTAESTLEFQDAIGQLRRQFAQQRIPLQQRLAEISFPDFFANKQARLQSDLEQQQNQSQNQFADQGLFFSGARDRSANEDKRAGADALLGLRQQFGDIAQGDINRQLAFLQTQQRAQEVDIANAINRQLALGFGSGELV